MIKHAAMIALALLGGCAGAAAQAPAQVSQANPEPLPDPLKVCDNKPVYMVVAGETLDRSRMLAYGKAIADSGIYATLHGYYVNAARPLAVFEGNVSPGYVTLIVRFPCLAHAHAFWYSETYQNTILPLRLDPSAGDYTVTVYAEADLPPYMAGKVGEGDYTKRDYAPADIAAVPQVDAAP